MMTKFRLKALLPTLSVLLSTLVVVACATTTSGSSAKAGTNTISSPALPLVELTTALGKITVEIDTVSSPITGSNFLYYVDNALYDSGSFHRTVTAANEQKFTLELIQAGISGTKSALTPPAIPLEPTSRTGITHQAGVISMARGKETGSATSEFFILIEDEPTLDSGGPASGDGHGYAAFGRVVSGMEVVRQIHSSAASGQKITPPVLIVKARRNTQR